MPRSAFLLVLLVGCVFAEWSPPSNALRPDATSADVADATSDGPTADAPAACSGRAVRALAVGYHAFGCAVRCGGDVWCWGRNSRGQLGRAFTSPSEPPGAVPSLGEGTLLAAGFDHVCTLAGGLWCWGSNIAAMLGNGTQDDSARPVDVTSFGAPIVSLAGGGLHACAALGAGDVWCWGDASRGQLGNDSRVMRLRPTLVRDLQGPAAQVVGGQFHACARLRSGDVSCWGQNTFGTLGDGRFVDRATPGLVPLPANAVDLASTDNHVCAALADGSVWCWGYNDQGQLGDGTRTTAARPVQVRGLTDARLVATGSGHTCARLSDGSVRCWGANEHGQLGDGTTTRRASPVSVSGLDGSATAIAAAAAFTCAALEDGRVMCWGDNGEGQLGVAASDDHTAPVEVPLPR